MYFFLVNEDVYKTKRPHLFGKPVIRLFVSRIICQFKKTLYLCTRRKGVLVAVARTAQSIAFQSRPCRLRLSLSEKRGASPRILSFCSISLAYFLRFSRRIGFQRKTLQLIIGRKRNAHVGFKAVPRLCLSLMCFLWLKS